MLGALTGITLAATAGGPVSVTDTQQVAIGMCMNRLKLRRVGLAAPALVALVGSVRVALAELLGAGALALAELVAAGAGGLRPRCIASEYAPWKSTPLAPRLERPG